MEVLPALARVENSDMGAWPPRLEREKLGKHSPALIYEAQRRNKCSTDTADMILSCSWGKYQEMGSTLYAPLSASGFMLTVSIFEYLQSSDMQDLFCRNYLIANNVYFSLNDILTDDIKRYKLARAYNGPGDVDIYAARLLAAAKAVLAQPPK